MVIEPEPPGVRGEAPLVEVRIPTYNRPAFLRRALLSLVAQTHVNWRAVVLDDGDAERTGQLLAELADPRILHRPNDVRLGAGGNISRAFSRESFAGGSFFYALEDDNLILPSFIEDNLRLMTAHGVEVVVNNQWVEIVSDSSAAESPVHDIWKTIDCFQDGVWVPHDFKIAMLWRLPLSNGALFWSRNARSDLKVADVGDAGVQEWVRCCRLDDLLYFNGTPNAFWRPESDLYSYTPNRRTFLQEQRLQQMMRRRVLVELRARGEIDKLLSDRFRTPLPVREIGVLRTYGRWPGPSHFGRSRRLKIVAKALAIRWLARAPRGLAAAALAGWPAQAATVRTQGNVLGVLAGVLRPVRISLGGDGRYRDPAEVGPDREWLLYLLLATAALVLAMAFSVPLEELNPELSP